MCVLGMHLSNLETFSKMLTVTGRRVDLLECFQGLMDHRIRIGEELVIKYCLCCARLSENPAARKKMINLGLRLGGFLSDCGWYVESKRVLLECRQLCLENNTTPENWCQTLECCRRLLHAEAEYCAFEYATETQLLALEMVKRLKEAELDECNYAALYVEFSMVHSKKNEYDQAYRWSIEALKQLKPTLPARVIIDVLRQAAKSCVLKREFQKAGLLIRQALYLARQVFDRGHPVYSNVLIDYGYYLLNFDRTGDSITVYEKALHIRETIFGRTNLHIALAHEDLGYALYVHEYSSGKFDLASYHAGKAIDIMEKLLHGDHLLLASARRVQALIFEEVALDSETAPLVEQHLLFKAECLHMSALELARKAFGEKNVQTAKHYGNLGRLYQSMKKFEAAEEMHVRAIQIKEEILGPDDHEVGLSVGHLASLYNYHMNRYRDAEKLYYRSIAIGLKLFGRSYTSLEYDYRGLLHVYTKLDEHGKVAEYEYALNNWKVLRLNIQSEDPPIDLEKRPQPIGDVIDTFFSM
ncbi:amyloid protein-binding protein 2 isoform X2 [Hylaeus anthracinus]|nr:amyloid protein-binding protein 2 isoform X2 [Hylaeus volcanicus]XP_053982754.1 amyloid protein-binding protein 2 isoform X2 [Hylaeus volcanicus]XP_053997491.1 amyloid protein-binding protein 2 isoform X2 [Hylaeus anthracinus]